MTIAAKAICKRESRTSGRARREQNTASPGSRFPVPGSRFPGPASRFPLPASRLPQVRIVAGRWRGRRISAPAGSHVRPTLDRVREAWMSILQLDLPNARVLDLYAGSGALGLEALSRGAVAADFVEKDPISFLSLEDNSSNLGAD